MVPRSRISNYTVERSFRDFLLSSTGSRVTRIFLCCEKKGGLDFIAPSDKQDMVTYLPGNKVMKVLISGIDPFSEEAGRSRIGVGRLVSRMFGTELLEEFKVTPSEIEAFVNSYKSFFDMSDTRMEVVEGEAIRHWYHEDRYMCQVSGTLWKSCMRYDKKQPFLDLYVRNPESVKMAVLLCGSGDNTRLRGRALLWQDARTPSSSVKFMDRIYTVFDSDVHHFKKWARDNGYICKAHQNSKSLDLFEVDAEPLRLGMRVHIKDHLLPFYPYMDTFQFYDQGRGVLHNVPDSPHDYRLDTAEGRLRVEDEEDSMDGDIDLEFDPDPQEW